MVYVYKKTKQINKWNKPLILNINKAKCKKKKKTNLFVWFPDLHFFSLWVKER